MALTEAGIWVSRANSTGIFQLWPVSYPEGLNPLMDDVFITVHGPSEPYYHAYYWRGIIQDWRLV